MDKLRRRLDVTWRSVTGCVEYRRDDTVYAAVHNTQSRNDCIRDDRSDCPGMERDETVPRAPRGKGQLVALGVYGVASCSGDRHAGCRGRPHLAGKMWGSPIEFCLAGWLCESEEPWGVDIPGIAGIVGGSDETRWLCAARRRNQTMSTSPRWVSRVLGSAALYGQRVRCFRFGDADIHVNSSQIVDICSAYGCISNPPLERCRRICARKLSSQLQGSLTPNWATYPFQYPLAHSFSCTTIGSQLRQRSREESRPQVFHIYILICIFYSVHPGGKFRIITVKTVVPRLTQRCYR